MANTYKLIISHVEAHRELDGHEKVIHKVHYDYLVINENGKRAVLVRSLDLPSFDSTNFVPFDEITKAKLIEWMTPLLDETAMQAEVDQALELRACQTQGKVLVYRPGNPTAGNAPQFISVSACAVQNGQLEPGDQVAQIVSPETGRIWMDRNLGADEVATASNGPAGYGSLYQWGRNSDGHELINWTSSTSGVGMNGTLNEQSDSDQPGHNQFINDFYDWRAGDGSAGLWKEDGTGVNNPCPTNFRIPTRVEWQAENITNATTAMENLKLPMAGYRETGNGSLQNVGTGGSYWSSTVDSGADSRRLSFLGGVAVINTLLRASGASVRCIKDD